MMRFRTDPRGFLAARETPLGVYARRELLHEVAKGDKALAERLRKEIIAKQLSDGSWNHSLSATAREVDALVDMGFVNDRAVEKGALWILARQGNSQAYREDFFAPTEKDHTSHNRVYTGEPIVSRASALFMHSNHALRSLLRAGYASDSQVRKKIKRLEALFGEGHIYCCGRCTQSVLQAFGVHPQLRGHDIAQHGLHWLAKQQKTTGDWRSVPFYHALHSLSYYDGREVERQMMRLLPKLERTQNKDGSWGKVQVDERTIVVARILTTIGEL
jgi:hypothetical protein